MPHHGQVFNVWLPDWRETSTIWSDNALHKNNDTESRKSRKKIKKRSPSKKK